MFPKRTRQVRAAKAQKNRSVITTLPSPTGGWNSRDAISDMPPTDAVEMVNFFPFTTSCDLRSGSELWNVLSDQPNTGNALLLDGISGFAQTNDSAALSVVGDIDLRGYVSLDNWSTAIPQMIICKGDGNGTFSYQLFIKDKTIHVAVQSGATTNEVWIVTTLPVSNGGALWVRATVDLTNGVNAVFTFYYGSDGINWTLYGSNPFVAPMGALNDTTSIVTYGTGISTSTLATSYLTGKIYRAQIYSGIGGLLVGSFNGNDADIGAVTVTSSVTGEIYVLQNSASIIYDPAVAIGSAPQSNIVESLMGYTGGTSSKLFAISSGTIWDATTQNSALAVSGVSLVGNRWGHVNIATAAGNYLFMVNQQGLDSPYHYNGANWAQPSITGITTTSIVNVNLHKNRLWFIQQGTLKAWYLPTQSIAGAVNSLDLSSFATRGGYLMAMATWTMDAGYGMDDMAAFITSEGEVLVYSGTDPANASTWSLIGIYWIGSPVGRRCYVKYAGDVLVICQDGVYPLSGALQSSRLNPRVAISDKIKYAVSNAVTLYGSHFGWQVIPYPKQNMVIVNVPVRENVEQEQYVMNTITGSWARFTDWNANCWELFNDDLYFAGNDKSVMLAWSGTSDNANAIEGTCLQAFNYFGSQGQQKRFTMMRPVFLANGDVPVSMRLNINFNQNTANDANSFSDIIVTGALWDQAIWDQDVWANDFLPSTGWRGASGVGFVAAPELGVSTADRAVKWLSTDVVLEAGAIL